MYATIIWCTNVPLRSFPLPNFLLKSFMIIEMWRYKQIWTVWKKAVTYLHVAGRSVILTLLCPPMTGTEPGRYTCVWGALFRRSLLTHMEEYWYEGLQWSRKGCAVTLCVCVYIYIYIYVCVCVCVYVCVFIYIYIYIYTSRRIRSMNGVIWF